MPSKPNSNSGRKSSAGGSGVPKSDDDIMKDRRKTQAIDLADTYLGTLGLALYATCFVWFVYFSDYAKVVSSLHSGASDPSLIMLVTGGFCRSLSKASPRLWSNWRLAFHMSWCPVFGLLALAAAGCSYSGPEQISAQTCWILVAVYGVLSAGALLTFPGSSLGSGQWANAPLGKALVFFDGAAGLALAASILVGTEWSEGMGPITSAMACLPLFPVAAALCLSSTDAELVAAVPNVMIFCTLASLRSMYYSWGENSWGTMAAAPTAILFCVHAYLYLPSMNMDMSYNDSEDNPFHTSLTKAWTKFMKTMSATVSAGYAEEGQGG